MIVKKSEYFERQETKLSENQKEMLDDIVWLLKQDPSEGNERKGRLTGIWDDQYDAPAGKMILCYQFNQSTLYLLGVFQLSQKI